MITAILCTCILVCIGFIVNLQMKVESLQATNDNCLHHITFLGSMIRDMENKLQERENNNENY